MTRHTQSPRRCSSYLYSKIFNEHVRNFVFSLHGLGELEQADMYVGRVSFTDQFGKKYAIAELSQLFEDSWH